MLPLILLSLLGIGGAAFLFDGGSSDFEPDDDEEDPKLTREGDTINATEGDDILGRADFDQIDDYVSANTINLLGGDDVFEHTGELSYGTIINGGEGDDSITSVSEYDDTLNGDAGNDTLTGTIGTSAFGGEGDDIINFDQPYGPYDGPTGIADGGDGNDTITVKHALGWNNRFDTTSLNVSGGNGADTFVVELIDGVETEDDGFEGTIQSEGADEAQVYIQDFNPAEDKLIVDISSFAANGNLDFVEAELTPEEAGLYQLSLSFMAEGATDPFVATLDIRSESTVTLDDIIITGNTAGTSDISGNTLSLTSGPDNLLDPVLPASVNAIEAGAGNDTIDHSIFGLEVFGNAGDDEITVGDLDTELSATIYGGDGNDTLSGINLHNSHLSGGGGDDVINLDQKDFEFSDGGVFVTGGSGDDTFNLNLDIPQSYILDDGVTVTNGGDAVNVLGDDGADTYQITLNEVTPWAGVSGGLFPGATLTGGEGPILEILDFDPTEDKLILDLSNSTGLADVQSAETRVGADGETIELVVMFENEAGDQREVILDLGDQDVAAFDTFNSIQVIQQA